MKPLYSKYHIPNTKYYIQNTIYKILLRLRRRLFLPASGLLLALVPIILYSTFYSPQSAKADSFFKFDEGYGTTSAVNDSNGAVSAGSITGATWKTNDLCFDGKCLYFDGDGDFVKFLDDDDLDFTGSDSMTLSLWFRHPVTIESEQTLIVKTGSGKAYEIWIDTGGHITFSIAADTGWTISSPLSYNDNKWHYLTAVKSTNTLLSLYIDSVKVDETPITSDSGDISNSGAFYIGISYDETNQDYNGFVDEVKIYRSARTEVEIKADFLTTTINRGASASFKPDQAYLSDGLAGYWKMDESSGNITDYSGNGNTLTNNGAAAFSAGKYGNGTSLDGTEKYFSVADNAALSPTSDLTLSAWIKPGAVSAGTSYTIAGKWDGDNQSYLLTQYGDEIRWYIDSSENFLETTSANLSTGNWYHLLGIYNAASQQAEIYLNGTKQTTTTSGTIPASIGDDTGVFQIGTVHSGNNNSSILKLISAGNNDADEYDNNTNFSSTSLTVFVKKSSSDSSRVNGGFRFTDLTIPKNSTINTATVYAMSSTVDPDMAGVIYAEAVDDSPSFTDNADLTGRSTTTASASWTDTLGGFGVYSLSPDISTIIQEIVNRSGWASGNDLTIIIKGQNGSPSADCRIYAYEISPDYASKLYIEYNPPAADFYQGGIDEVRLYNRALSPAEVRQLADWAPGPVAHWKMDENSGTTTYDSSGNGNTSTTWTGDVSWITGKFGSGLNFDGTDDVVRFAETSSTDIGLLTDSFTVEAWFKTTTNSSSYPNLVAKNDGSGNYPFVLCLTSDEALRFIIQASGTPYVNSASALNDGKWHHGVGIRDVSTDKLYLYLDGVLVSSAEDTTTSTAVNDDNITIGNGGTSYTQYDFTDSIDDVRIYNYARTPAQIIEDMNAGHPTPGSPVGSAYIHYKFDEGYGTTSHNSGNGGNDLDATITSGTWTNSGKFGKAITFTASTSVTDTIADPAYNNTLSLWVYPTTSAASKTLVTSGKLTTDSSSRPVYGGCTGTALPLDTWTHIVAVSDGSGSCAIYQNGNLTASGSSGVTFGTSLNIGGTSFAGTIDEFKLYTLAMIADQVKTEYNRGKSALFGATGTDSSGNPTWSTTNEYCPPGQGSACVGPVAEWKFDEKTGTTAYDSSGNNTHATLYNNMPWENGKHGGAIRSLNNNGVLEYAQTSDNDLLDFSNTDDYTLGAWIKFGESENYYLGLRKTGDSPGRGYYLGAYNNRVWCTYRYDTTYDEANYSTTITNWGWHYISCVMDRNGTATGTAGLHIFVDGILRASDTSLTASDARNSGGVRFGESHADYEGDTTIDDARIYNYARTPAQIAWDYNQGGPVAWYRFDEAAWTADCASDTVFDASITNSNHGDSCPNGTGQTTPETGKLNNAMHFDNANDYVSVPDHASLDLTSGLSVSAWVNTDAEDANNVIVSKGTSYEVGINADGDIYWYNGSTTEDDSGAKVLAGTWHHVVVTNDDTTVTYYVDGRLTGTDVAGIGADNSTALSLGYDGSNYFDGLLDDIRIYNYTITQQQINDIYNSGAVRFD